MLTTEHTIKPIEEDGKSLKCCLSVFGLRFAMMLEDEEVASFILVNESASEARDLRNAIYRVCATGQSTYVSLFDGNSRTQNVALKIVTDGETVEFSHTSTSAVGEWSIVMRLQDLKEMGISIEKAFLLS